MIHRKNRGLGIKELLTARFEGANKKANLVIISFDQWRGDWCDTHNPVVNLETLRGIANKGLTMKRCYTNSPQCVPARFSWITGLQPSQLGVTENEDISLPNDAPSKIRELKRRGWHTTIIGKTHWSTHNQSRDLREDEELIHQLGFDEVLEIAGPRALRIINCEITDEWNKEGWLDKQRDDLYERYRGISKDEAWRSRATILPNHLYPDIWIANKAKKYIDKLPDNRPWILWISFVGPHEPFDTPQPWRGLTKDKQLPEPVKKRDWINKLDERNQIKKIDKKWKDRITADRTHEFRKDYADHLLLLDDQVGDIHKKLKQRNDYSNTGILIMADHGEMLGDGGMLYKSTFIESAIHVPMIYKQPGGSIFKRNCRKPVNLTKVFQVILSELETGGKGSKICRQAKKEKGAVIEFAKERAFIQENKKVCMDYDGNILWATDIKNDPMEETNQADLVDIEKNKNWKKLIDWARKESKQRNRLKWIWRDLLKNKYDQT